DAHSYSELAKHTSESLCRQYPCCKAVANTFRMSDETALNYFATFYQNDTLYLSRHYQAGHIVDQVGSGDCFMAGLIFGQLNAYTEQETIEFAAAAGFNKLFIKGDATTSSPDDI